MVVHLTACDIDLDQQPDEPVRTSLAARCIGQHAQRRFECMGKVSRLCARTFDDFRILCQHGIEIFDQRHDLDRKLAFEPLRLTATHLAKCISQRAQWCQPDKDLHHSAAGCPSPSMPSASQKAPLKRLTGSDIVVSSAGNRGKFAACHPAYRRCAYCVQPCRASGPAARQFDADESHRRQAYPAAQAVHSPRASAERNRPVLGSPDSFMAIGRTCQYYPE